MGYTKSCASVPLCQMLSGKHDHATIASWLEKWVKCVRNPPREIIIDESAALLLAVVKSFTQFNLVIEYLNCCHRIIDDEEAEVELPKCFIRHDVSHIVKNLKKSKIFEKVDKRIKRFYLLCIGTLFKLEQFVDLKNVIKDILCIVLSQFESPESEASRKRITELIGSH